MPRDFLEPGGFGETLGSDVSRWPGHDIIAALYPTSGEPVIDKPAE